MLKRHVHILPMLALATAGCLSIGTLPILLIESAGFGSLTIVVQRTSVKSEVVSTFPSFRFPELSQPI
jgi:hypothetical protein